MTVFSAKRTSHEIRFGTDGWRALIAKEFTYDNLHLVAAGIAKYILDTHGKSKSAVVGYDARFLADKFAHFAADVLNSYGINVKIVNSPVPTPVIAHAAKEEDSCGALMFTASHNPPEYMGIKFIPEYAGPATVEITNAILTNIDDLAEKSQSLSREEREKLLNGSEQAQKEIFDPSEAYYRDLRKVIDFEALRQLNESKCKEGSELKIAYDPLYGAGINFTDKLLAEAGFKTEVLHNWRDPLFGGGMPEPKEEYLQELKQVLTNNETGKFLMGASNDGDADRFAFLDANGEFYPANKILPIIFKYLVEKKSFKGCVARTVATTHLLDDLADKLNMKKHETAVGFKWLCEIMRREDTVLAGEESGGMSILGHIPEKDGILAILLMAEILANTSKTIEELWNEVQDFVSKKYYYDRLDLHLAGAKKDKFVKLFVEETPESIANFKVTKVDTTEGAKIYLENGSWFLARPSGTEAMCRVYFESNNKADLEKIVSAVGSIVETI